MLNAQLPVPWFNTCQSEDRWTNYWKYFGVLFHNHMSDNHLIQSFFLSLCSFNFLSPCCTVISLPCLSFHSHSFHIIQSVSQSLWSPYSMANRLHFILSLASKKSPQIPTSLKFGSSLKMPLPCGGFRVGYSGSQCPLWVSRWNGCSPGYSHLLTPPPSCKNFSFDIYANQLYFLVSDFCQSLWLVSHSLKTAHLFNHLDSLNPAAVLGDFDVDVEASPYAPISQFLSYIFSTALTLFPDNLLRLEHTLNYL